MRRRKSPIESDPERTRVVIVHDEFDSDFKRLMGFPRFEWQKCLYRDYFAKGQIPAALDIPTGLGKTSVMAIWYLALKAGATVPRRLVYVVDRRAVVDQATTVADAIREKSDDSQLRVSTLRGQHVDNREWLADPAAPAIVVGTVDMIGSRLLFSGYGVSRKIRPYHAGLLAADALLVLDEAHLVPPFEKLLEAIANGAKALGPQEQDREIVPPFKLLSLSATGREDGAAGRDVFRLSPKHRQDQAVRKRLEAGKRLTIRVFEDAPKLVPQLAERAWSLGEGPARVLVYCDRREDAVKAKDTIDKKFKKEKRGPVSELLVGGRRMLERENLSDWLQEHGFFGNAEAPEQPTFLIATSAGEVGVDLDADHMVCDLVEWERMVQRLGRVNRRGKGDACIEVIATPHAKEKGEEWQHRLDRLRKPLDALRPAVLEDVEEGAQPNLPFAESGTSPAGDTGEKPWQTSGCEEARDASPGAILDLTERAEQDQDLQDAIEEATTPVPLRPALTRALVDAWSLTSLDEHTGRPEDIQPWLRGWEEDQQPQTTAVWRKHLPVRGDGTETREEEVEAFFEATPPHASEKLETETHRVIDWLVKHARRIFSDQSSQRVDGHDSALRREDVMAYILSPSMDLRDTVRGHSLVKGDKKEEKEARENLKKHLTGGALVMDSRFGGLSKEGMLKEGAGGPPRVIDDGEEWLSLQSDDSPIIRFRVRSITAEESPESDGNWRERHRFEVDKTDEGDVTRWLLVEKWRSDSETEEDRSAGPPQELAEHQVWVECKVRALASALGLPDAYAEMLMVAARLHDEGKRHERWQRAFNAPRDGKVYAKTKGPIAFGRLDGYRHEFGSLPYAESDEEFKTLPSGLQELALHLIASHHGWGRPVICTSGGDDPPSVLKERARDVALRFARLQKRWGPWGLAWWEALLRAGDQQASRDNDAGEGA